MRREAVFSIILLPVVFLMTGCRHRSPTSTPVHAAITSKPTASNLAKAPALPELPAGGVRGVHVTGWIAGGKKSLDRIVGLCSRTCLNAVVIDIIDDGQLSYNADVPLAGETHASKHMFKIDRVVETLSQNHVWPIARIACMRNTPLAFQHPEMAIHNAKGGVWRDGSGYAWLNPGNQQVREYCVNLALDAIKHGFREIQFDYVRYPSYHVSTQVIPGLKPPHTREDEIVDFVKYAGGRIREQGAWFSVDVFGLTSLVKDDEGIGQKFQKVVHYTDRICPMIYPSHYAKGEYGIPDPDKEPYKIVSVSVRDALRRLKDTPGCRLRPWLQDFSLKNHYGAVQLKAQIQALQDQGVEEYLLWNPRCEYSEAGITKRS